MAIGFVFSKAIRSERCLRSAKRNGRWVCFFQLIGPRWLRSVKSPLRRKLALLRNHNRSGRPLLASKRKRASSWRLASFFQKKFRTKRCLRSAKRNSRWVCFFPQLISIRLESEIDARVGIYEYLNVSASFPFETRRFNCDRIGPGRHLLNPPLGLIGDTVISEGYFESVERGRRQYQ